MTQAEIAEGTVVGGDFRIVRSLHAGAFASVFEAVEVSSGTRRVLKVVTGPIGKEPRFRQVFLDEAKRVAGLKSERVAAVVASGVDATLDVPFGVMELCAPPGDPAEPVTLAARMENAPLGPREEASPFYDDDPVEERRGRFRRR